MPRIRWAILAAAALVVLIPATAAAAPPVVTDPDVGRRLVAINLPGGGKVACSAQGQFLDTNGNGLSDSLRGRSACLEDHGVHRIRILWTQVQSDFADTWAPALTQHTDAVSPTQPSYAVSITPSSRYCPPPGDFGLLYRVQARVVFREVNNQVSYRTVTSHIFEARAVDAALNNVC